MRQGSRAQGESPQDRLVAACQDTVARHRSSARWRIHRGRQGWRRQGFGPVATAAPACFDDTGRTSRGLGRRADPDDTPGRIIRYRPPLRHHLVSGRDPQIPASPQRGTGCVVLSAGVCAGLAAVLPGGDRQGAGASLAEHARRAGHRPGGDLAVRDHFGHPADLSVLAHHQPHRRRTRRAAVPPFARAADGLFPGAPRRRFRGARARAGEHPQFPHQLGADAGHRPAVHVRIPGGDVRLFAAPDMDRAGLVPLLHRDLGRCDAAVPAAARREIPPGRREPGLPGRERDRGRDAQGHGGRAADAAPLGGAARRLCRRELSRAQPGQYGQPVRPAHQQAGRRRRSSFSVPGWSSKAA